MRKMRRARAEGKLGRTQGTHAKRRVEGRGRMALRREPTQTFDAVGRPVVSCVCELEHVCAEEVRE